MDYMNDKNAFKPIKENPIILDFSGVQYLGEMHLLLKEKFGLPEYYGENWDALWDCLDGLFYKRGDFGVEIYGSSMMDEELLDEFQLMLEVFEDVHKSTPNVTFKVIT